MSRTEVLTPFELYWEEGAQGNSTRFFNDGMQMGVESTSLQPFTKKDDCVQVAIDEMQNFNLIIPSLRGLWLRVEMEEALTETAFVGIASILSDALEIPVYPVVSKDVSDTFACAEKIIRQLYFELTDHLFTAQKLDALEENFYSGDLSSLVKVVVIEMEVAGLPSLSNVVPCFKVEKAKKVRSVKCAKSKSKKSKKGGRKK